MIKSRKFALILIVFCIFLAPVSHSQEVLKQAFGNIDPVKITTTQVMVIPKMVIPESGSRTLEITTNGAIGPTSNVDRMEMDQQSASLLVRSENDGKYMVDIITTSVPPGVTINKYIVSWDRKLVTSGIPFNVEIEKNKNYVMLIGINLSINNTVPEGPIKIGFRVTVN